MKLNFKQIFEDISTNAKKRKTIAFFAGSMKPPHIGHWASIMEYAKIADEVIVLISKPSIKSVRKTATGAIISPEQAKKILEIYKSASHANNVTIEISKMPSPLPSVIRYMNDHKMRDVNIILGASDKDDDYTRWTNDYVKGVIDRIEHEPNNIKFLDPKETATHCPTDKFKGATFIRNHINDFNAIQDQLPDVLSDKQKHQVFDIMNTVSETIVKDERSTPRQGITKLYQLNPTQIKRLFNVISPKLNSTGLDMKVIIKSDGSTVRVAWNDNDVFIESSHSGLVSDPERISFVPGFAETLRYLQIPKIRQRLIDVKGNMQGVKLIGELLFNDEQYRDLDQSVTFVGTKYDSTKLGNIATIIVFDALEMTDTSLTPLDDSHKNSIIENVCSKVSDKNISFMPNRLFTKQSTITIDMFSNESRSLLNNIESLSKEQLMMLRDEFESIMIKYCQNIEKPEIVKADVIEGIIFEIEGLGQFAVQNPAWVETKKNFFKYRTIFDETVMKFIKNVTGWQQRKKILSIFDTEKNKWNVKYQKMLPTFLKDLDKSYNDFIAHKNEVPAFVYAISKKLIDDVYNRMSKMTSDINSFKTALDIHKVSESIVNEGGHLTFKHPVSRINQENVKSTLQSIYDKLLPIFKLSEDNVAVTGTTGKKLPGGTSGDIDMGLDLTVMANTIGVKDFAQFKDFAEKHIDFLDDGDLVSVPTYRVVSLSWPIANEDGKQPDSYVQVDLMPVYDINWIKFGEGHPHERIETWKGACRNQILMSIALHTKMNEKTIDINGVPTLVEYDRYMLSPRDGLFKLHMSRAGKKDPTKLLKDFKKTSETIVSTDPKKVLQILFNTDDIFIDDFVTTMGTWKKFVESPMFSDEKFRNSVLTSAINDLRRNHIKYPPEFDKALTDKTKLIATNESTLNICESGAVASHFGEDKAPRINKANIDATVQSFLDAYLKKLGINKNDIQLVGSTGKKPTSGDIDIGIDGITDIKAFLRKAEKIFDNDGVWNVASYGLNEITIAYPNANVDGKQPNTLAQIDLMPIGNINMLKWGMHSPSDAESKYKGAVRNVLLQKIAAFTNMKSIETAIIDGVEQNIVYSKYALETNSGLYYRTYSRKGSKPGTITKAAKIISSKLVSDNPIEIVKLIFGPSVKPEDVMTIDQLWKQFQKTDIYKDTKLRSKIVSLAVNDYSHRNPPLKYPSYMDAAIVECKISTITNNILNKLF